MTDFDDVINSDIVLPCELPKPNTKERITFGNRAKDFTKENTLDMNEM